MSRRRLAAVVHDEVGLFLDRRDILEHRLALVRIDAERADHVDKAVGVDVFLVGVAPEHELEFGCRDHLAHDVKNVVADDAFRRGKVADSHLDDPALDVRDARKIAPLFAVLLHLDVLRLPMVGLHRLVKLVGPLVFQGEDVEEHCLPPIDDALGGVCRFRLVAIEVKLTVSKRNRGCGHICSFLLQGAFSPVALIPSSYHLSPGGALNSARRKTKSQQESIYSVPNF